MVYPRNIRVLLVEDDAGETRNIQKLFSEIENSPSRLVKEKFELFCADKFSTAIAHMSSGETDAVLLDLTLPENNGIEAFSKLHGASPDTPVIILADSKTPEDDTLQALAEGAYDFLEKSKLSPETLSRSIRYAAERYDIYRKYRSASSVDELTGLYNRQGFFMLGQQQLRLVQRIGNGAFLLLANFNHLKTINETHGYKVGDKALFETGSVLRKSFRDSDIIARITSDEFTVLGMETARVRAEILTTRLSDNIEKENAKNALPFKISVDVVVTKYDPLSPGNIEDLLKQSETLMQEHKNKK